MQFGLRAMFAVTAALAMLFGVMSWLGVPPVARFVVLVVLAVSVPAAIALVVVIAGSVSDEKEEDE